MSIAVVDDEVKMDDGSRVILGWAYLQCTCRAYLGSGTVNGRCEHIEEVLDRRLDADWIAERILRGEAKAYDLAIPLFTWTDPDGVKSQYVYKSVTVRPKTTPVGVIGKCRFQVPSTGPAGDWGDFPGTLKAAGDTFAPGGVVIEGEGRRDIAASISSWVAGQLAVINSMQIAELECDSFLHLSTAPMTPLDKVSIVLFSECTDCITHKSDPSGDVPDF